MANAITATALSGGKFGVDVSTEDPGTKFRVVASKAGSSVRWVWNNLTTNADGEFAFRTSRGLSGARLRLIVGGVTVARSEVVGARTVAMWSRHSAQALAVLSR